MSNVKSLFSALFSEVPRGAVNFRTWPLVTSDARRLLKFQPAAAFQKRQITLPTLSGLSRFPVADAQCPAFRRYGAVESVSYEVPQEPTVPVCIERATHRIYCNEWKVERAESRLMPSAIE